jgi:hypothetical protein
MQDYFALQLTVSAHYARIAGVPMDVAIARCTNLRRRFRLTEPDGEPQWAEFLAEVGASRGSEQELLLLCMRRFDAGRAQPASTGFGPFSFDAPGPDGALRLHFMPQEPHAESPLASAGIGDRLDELRALFEAVRRRHRDAASVRGYSWLYHLPAYLRLFPPAYRRSVRAPTVAPHLTGSSVWGQVLDWRQRVKPAMREAVLSRLPAMEVAAPWRIFPLQPLAAECAIAEFDAWLQRPR